MRINKTTENNEMVQCQIEMDFAGKKFETTVWFDKRKYLPHINNPNLRELQTSIYDQLIYPELLNMGQQLSKSRQLTLTEMLANGKKTEL